MSHTLSYYLLQILNALSFSALLMLAGLGLSLVLSLMNFINLTHGSFSCWAATSVSNGWHLARPGGWPFPPRLYCVG